MLLFFFAYLPLFFIDMSISICNALRGLVPFVQLKKSETHPWKSITFSKVAG